MVWMWTLYRLVCVNIYLLPTGVLFGESVDRLGGGTLLEEVVMVGLTRQCSVYSRSAAGSVCSLPSHGPGWAVPSLTVSPATSSSELFLVRFLWRDHKKFNQHTSRCVTDYTTHRHHWVCALLSRLTPRSGSRWELRRWRLFWFSSLRLFLIERAASLVGFWNGVMCDNCFGILKVLWYWIGSG